MCFLQTPISDLTKRCTGPFNCCCNNWYYLNSILIKFIHFLIVYRSLDVSDNFIHAMIFIVVAFIPSLYYIITCICFFWQFRTLLLEKLRSFSSSSQKPKLSHGTTSLLRAKDKGNDVTGSLQKLSETHRQCKVKIR